MKVAVYNRYWRTLGGGERYCGFLAETLSRRYEVDLLAHEPLDRSLISERLGVDLSGVGIRFLPHDDDIVFGHETSKYGLLVNTSFGSDAACAAARGIYVCHFPVPHEPLRTGPSALLTKLMMGRRHNPAGHIEWGEGWFGHEQARDVYRWSTEQPTLKVWMPKGRAGQVQLLLLRLLPKTAPPTEVEISVDGEKLRTLGVEPGRGRMRVNVPIVGKGVHHSLIEIRCTTFSPKELLGADDPRRLGVALVADQSGRPANGFAYIRGHYSQRPHLRFLDTYDQVVSHSRYTQQWVERLWNRDSRVVSPPVAMQTEGDKEPIILSVGRFFDRAGSHSKKQLEMVRAFSDLVQRGLRGWTYHLVGGCEEEDRPYLEEVKRLADGLPVELHVGASGAELKDLYARASIFWHATGLGEDERIFPERFEHFGMTSVEAMSAGAVPIVIGKAGQLEVLVDGVHGMHFKDLRELVERTWQVVHDDELRKRLSAAAMQRAQKYGPEVFNRNLEEVVDEVLSR